MTASVADPPTPINTKHVRGRRRVRFETFDDVVAEAERLSAVEVRTLGNWSYAQILDHLAKSIHAMIDGVSFRVPLPMRLVFGLFMKKRMLTETLPTGFNFPASSAPQLDPLAGVETADAIQSLRAAVERAKSCPDRAPHPAFGAFSREEWDAFQLRHCEMHMGFVVPA